MVYCHCLRHSSSSSSSSSAAAAAAAVAAIGSSSTMPSSKYHLRMEPFAFGVQKYVYSLPSGAGHLHGMAEVTHEGGITCLYAPNMKEMKMVFCE